MFVHRCVGEVNFLACDLVLGAQGTTAHVKGLLQRIGPDTLIIDLSLNDVDRLPKREPADPILAGLMEAIEPVADEDALQPYDTVIEWAETHQAQLHPIGPRSSPGWVQGRRIRKVWEQAEGPNPETRARSGLQHLLKDDRVGDLARRHRQNLADSLESILEREPPRTVAIFAFPWAEMVSTDVRRAMGLHRMEGDELAGGWPA